jgi:hypothetical protein
MWRVVGIACLAVGCAATVEDEAASVSEGELGASTLRMNQLQMKASHNSYHKARWFLPSASLNYTHEPLDEQLEKQGVRGFELDLHHRDGKFEVYHIPFDTGSTCKAFEDCLRTLKTWSDAHRDHHPLIVQLEIKEGVDDESDFKALEDEITKVWPVDRLVTPDLVKGSAPTLRTAVTTTGWPAIDSVRGRVMFAIQAGALQRTVYTRGDKNLDGRVCFVHNNLDAPYGAFAIIDDPKGEGQKIRDAVKAGFIVRTRADADLKEPKKNDTSRLEAALASGAQLVSTDFPAKDSNYDYVVEIPGGTPSRCNPVLDVDGCTSQKIEP